MRKYLRTDNADPPQYGRPSVATQLTPLRARAGGYTRLTDCIRDWRAQQGGVAIGNAFVPLAFDDLAPRINKTHRTLKTLIG